VTKVIPKIQTKSSKRTVDLKTKNRAYVEGLFGVGDATNYDDFPDNYDPLDVIAEEAEFDLAKMMDKALDPVTGLPRDIRLPEGDFAEAKNYFDWCTNGSGTFTGPDDKIPFARQMWAATHLLAEYCPRCSHPKWNEDVLNLKVGTDPRKLPERVQFLEYGVCPKCKATKAEMTLGGELNLYVEGAWCWGQRAGKSTVTGSLANYVLHKYLKAPKMSSICDGIKASTPLTATFVGLRFADAMALLWEPITKGILDSPWFTEYHKMLDDYGKRLGIEFYRFKDQYLRYEHKNIELYPAGPSKRALRGRTRFLTGLDELGWFPIGQENKDMERADADEVHKALDRSLLTVRNEVRNLYKKGFNSFLPGIAINISSPSDETDKICRLVEENKNSTRVLALRLATWDINPLYTREQEEIADAYKKDPVAAERDYGANPPMNAKTFIEMKAAAPAFTGINRAHVETVEKQINERMRRAGKVVSTNPPQPMPASILALDAGYSNNSFALTVMYPHTMQIGEIKTTRVHVPVLCEIQTRLNVVLHYHGIYKFIIKPLIEAFNVHFVFADRWNSIALLDQCAEDYQSRNLISKQYSVKYIDHQSCRSYVEEQKMVLPALEMPFEEVKRVEGYPQYFEGKPAAHLLFQMGTIRDVGSTVIKGGVYTDDLWRALVLGNSRLHDPKIAEELAIRSAATTRGRMVGAVSSGKMNMLMQGGRNVSAAKHTVLMGTAARQNYAPLGPAVPGSEKKSNVVRVQRSF
jgi:hypothetical protein